MTELLGAQKGIEAVAEFIRATGAFTKSGREAWRRALEEDANANPAPAITTFKVAVTTVLDANDRIDDLLSGLIVFLKYRRPNFAMNTTVPVTITYGLDKQDTGERGVLIFDP
ncbi:hypothetical protein FS837_004335, partial [Tulasnella sp. UAMH 9824]